MGVGRMSAEICEDGVAGKKPEFYLFLDIDGVLWDIKHKPLNLAIMGGLLYNLKSNRYMVNEGSREAYNRLLSTLNEKYHTNLIITSSWRMTGSQLTIMFYKEKLILPDTIYVAKKKFPLDRNKVINAYLDRLVKDRDYLILDDRPSVKRAFRDKTIKTSIWNHALSRDDVDEYLTGK